jgi:hypothetical protein
LNDAKIITKKITTLLTHVNPNHRAARLGTVHYLWRGVAPKRRGLGKLNFE